MGKFDNIFIVSDIDNTFLASDKTIPLKNIEALDYFKKKGGKFTFATGRSHLTLLNAFPDAAELLNAPAVLSNGSYLFDFQKDEILYPMYLEKNIALDVARFIIEDYPDTGIRILTTEKTLYSSINKYIFDEIARLGKKVYSEYQSPKDWTGEAWCKIVVRDDPERLDEIRSKMENKFADFSIEICKSEADFLEIQAKGCNKGRGIEILRQKYLNECPGAKIYVCGDYENDISMMKVADVAVCPSNACESVKNLSDMCLCPCDDGVIANLIYEI